MADAVAMLDDQARRLYEADLAKRKRTLRDVFWPSSKNESWDAAPNHIREEWRMKALTAVRSRDTLEDEMKREDRERRRVLSERAAPNGEKA